MNKKMLLYFFILNLCVFEKSLANMFCQESKLKKSIHSVFYSRIQNSLWISTSEETTEIFKALKLEKILNSGPVPMQVKDKTPGNSVICAFKSDFLKAYQSNDFTFEAINVCEETRIKKLGFLQAKRSENYGSMENGYPLFWHKIGLCTDGKSLYHCAQPTLDMQLCLKKAANALFSPPFGVTERLPTTQKKPITSKKKLRS